MPRSTLSLPIAAALLAFLPAPALACLQTDTRPVEVQMDEWARDSYAKADAVVEVVVLRGSWPGRPGLVRVERVFKGPLKRGRKLTLHSRSQWCDRPRGFVTGSRGLTLINRLGGRMRFQGWLPDDYLQRLDRLGLRPLDTPLPSTRRR